jgi:uncharacterized protein
MRHVSMLLAVAALAVACGQPEKPAPGPAAQQVAPPPGGAQLANPASVNCEKKGGRLEIRTEPAGQYGVCVFADGSRCEEWALFRGKCRPGECRDDSGRCSKTGE